MRSAAVLVLLFSAACSGGGDDDDAPPIEGVCPATVYGWTIDVGDGSSFARSEQAAFAERVVERLPEAEAAWPTRAPESCGDPEALSYLRGLAAHGDTAECLSYALACTGETTRDPDTVGALAFVGAGCAADEHLSDEARALYELATAADSIGECPDEQGRAFLYAWFEISLSSGTDLGAILARADGWDPAAAEDALRQLATGATSSDPAALERWVADAVAGADPLLAQFLTVSWIGQVAYVYGDRARALRLVDANLEPLTDSGRMRTVAASTFSLLYSLSDGEFSIARQIYDGYIPVASPFGWLPAEQNVLTYTEIYRDDCADGLLAGDALAGYHALRSGWIAGDIATADALDRTDALLAAEGERAELLSLRGALLEAGGDVDGAADAYWRAHEVCPYYNRAHWALDQIHFTARLHNGTPLEAPPLPPEDALASYVLNHGSLDQDELAGLRYALRIWLPYLEELVAAGNGLYVKRPFELLSEAPGHADLRDQRISYEGDHRLWDDVRGLGGNPVVADLSEVMLAPYGAYNLAIHEVGHQVHFAAPKAIGACIDALYQAADERGVFVNYYASYNPAEYFAEGVTYFSVPADAPATFGTNRQWLTENDPNLEAFIIEFESETPLADVTCPVELPAASLRPPSPEPPRSWRLLHGTTQHRPGDTRQVPTGRAR